MVLGVIVVCLVLAVLMLVHNYISAQPQSTKIHQQHGGLYFNRRYGTIFSVGQTRKIKKLGHPPAGGACARCPPPIRGATLPCNAYACAVIPCFTLSLSLPLLLTSVVCSFVFVLFCPVMSFVCLVPSCLILSCLSCRVMTCFVMSCLFFLCNFPVLCVLFCHSFLLVFFMII